MTMLYEPLNFDIRPRPEAERADIRLRREMTLLRDDPEQAFRARRLDVLRRTNQRDQHEPQLYSKCKPYYHKRGLRNCQKGGL